MRDHSRSLTAAALFLLLLLYGGATEHAWAQGELVPVVPSRPPFPIQATTAEGEARLEPSALSVAEIRDYAVHVVVGPGGIGAGGSLLVDFPKPWFTNPFPLMKPLQQKEAWAPHYVSVRSSRDDVRLVLEWGHFSLQGKSERFRNLMHVRVEDAPLAAGDEIVVTFANTTAPQVAGPDRIGVGIDATGDGHYRMLADGARYHVSAGAAASIRLIAPSQAVVGKAVDLQLVAFDAFYNPADGASGSFEIHGLGASPLPVELRDADNGVVRFAWTPEETGVHRPMATGESFSVVGGPIRAWDTAPALNLYWGDLHSHSRISKDGIGGNDFLYARDITRLDFYASTEHAGDDGWLAQRPASYGITDDEWRGIVDAVRDTYDPGRFVTLLAYECSLGGGHHNVFFRGVEGVPLPPSAVGDVETLWAQLAKGEAFTVPHHPGIVWGGGAVDVDGPDLQPIRTASRHGGGPTIDWTRRHDPELRPSLEIYSAHGQSELYDPRDPLAYEQVRFTPAASADGPHYARDAWAAGHPMGVVAASDNHGASPGLPHLGLTAVFAPQLTREAIFDALLGRRSYGTTGERILLGFELGGALMGEEAAGRGTALGRVDVEAPSEIRFAEVMAFEEGSSWRAVARWDTPGTRLEAPFEVEVGEKGVVAYLRVELVAPTEGRVARAWSSPVWIRPSS